MSYEFIEVEKKGRITIVTMNRPERRNALNANVMAGLNQYFDQAGAAPDVSAIILTGAGGNFCSGADLGGSFGGDQSYLDMHYDRGHYADLLVKMNKCKKPILAAIEGYCLAGGMGLCMSSDVVIASEDAQFGVPEIKRGLWPYMVTAVLIRNVGRKKAAELCMTGDRIPADVVGRSPEDGGDPRCGLSNSEGPRLETPVPDGKSGIIELTLDDLEPAGIRGWLPALLRPFKK